MDKAQLLKHLKEDVYCRMKQSGVHGVGVFAIRNIPAGTKVFKGAKRSAFIEITQDEIHDLHPEVKAMLNDFFAVYDNKMYVPEGGLTNIDISFYLNHSEHPNVRFDEAEEEFIALRDIAEGEELLADYSSFDEGWKTTS